MTRITEFKTIWVGKDHPAVVSIDNFSWGGLLIQYHKFYKYLHKIQLRKKENEYAFIIYQYSETELPEWWEDSEILWEEEVLPPEE